MKVLKKYLYKRIQRVRILYTDSIDIYCRLSLQGWNIRQQCKCYPLMR